MDGFDPQVATSLRALSAMWYGEEWNDERSF